MTNKSLIFHVISLDVASSNHIPLFCNSRSLRSLSKATPSFSH